MNRRRIVLTVLALALAGVLFYLYAGHTVPKGQQPLADLDAARMDSLKEAFNQSASSIRVLVMLSPT